MWALENHEHRTGERGKRNEKIGESWRVLALSWELEAAAEEAGGGVTELGLSLREAGTVDVSGGEVRRSRGQWPGCEEWQCGGPAGELRQTTLIAGRWRTCPNGVRGPLHDHLSSPFCFESNFGDTYDIHLV